MENQHKPHMLLVDQFVCGQKVTKYLQRPEKTCSFRDVLLALSGWGFIPRMDVTPLEHFDEVGL
jgi:hypothetical protein